MIKATSLVVVILGCLGLTACADAVTQKDDMLAAAGFRIKLADTPERLALLKKLPPHKFTMRTTPNGSVSFLYADPTICKCLYYGDETAYATYRQMALAQQLADKRLMAAQMEQDASWNWRAWGPSWGPYGWY